MVRSAKQRRFLEATEAQRGYTPGAVGSMRTPSPGNSPGLTMPGGAVQSGGYVATTKTYSMPGLRKVR